jgi:mono/diheme cytochrome c family protein
MRLLILLFGCEGVMPGVDWQQMNQQHKFQPFEACDYFPDGRAMQPPPPGTVPRERPDEKLEQPTRGGAYLDEIPLPLTRELFARGRFAFETYCAACHGADGSGRSEVARNMELRKPPSLMDERVRRVPVGRLFQVASEGYGLMPSYALELTARERWAAVAWLRALQQAYGVSLDDLSPSLRVEALKELP